MATNSNTPQLPLELNYKSANLREDLIESQANKLAIDMVDAWPNWPGKIVVLAGPIGSGKSHIANIWITGSKGVTVHCYDISAKLDDLIGLAEVGSSILIEDADSSSLDEIALFHLLNAVKQGGGYCMITSRFWLSEWEVELPDLASRLKAAQVVELQEPDDVLLKHVMMKLFSDRQLLVDEKILDYCVIRMERSLESAAKLVEEIDVESLARKTSVTRATAARALEKLGMG